MVHNIKTTNHNNIMCLIITILTHQSVEDDTSITEMLLDNLKILYN